ncbi:hypothetical protein [Paenibacillus wynnii]|uniref:hypothetical protein n=1 Tax=Paenibacillus wynnii TaxID=268407 RepID=UPI00278EEE01|nr:hypothetical protein [Paenibacillus wynnii]MDQ0191862.1 hypothetical protein [Paenibacillus wynnii]
MDKKLQSTDGNYLFNVDILINARTNPLAMQYLLELLNNHDKVTDFNINSGLELGRTIDSLLRSAKLALKQEISPPIPVDLPQKIAVKQTPSPLIQLKPQQPTPQAMEPSDAFVQIRQYIQSNQLVRIRANRHGKQVSMPCRILNFDETAKTLSVYHVDEKQVYTFKLNEIDEFH